MNNTDLLDNNTIESLRSVLQDDMNELFQKFINDCPSTIERLANAIHNNNLQEINQAAHYLKGCSGNIGAIAFSNACQTLEQQARENALIDPATQMNNVRQLFAKTVSYMQKQMD